MTTTILDIGTLITHSDEIKNEKPIITGTGITVNRIVSWYKRGYLRHGFQPTSLGKQRTKD